MKKATYVAVLGAILFLFASNTATYARSSTETEVRRYFAAYPVMIAIARCESKFQQYEGGRGVVKNPNSSATGVFQIMASVHRKAAKRLGFDIHSLRGNLGYAKHLYKAEGTSPWNASRHCWRRK